MHFILSWLFLRFLTSNVNSAGYAEAVGTADRNPIVTSEAKGPIEWNKQFNPLDRRGTGPKNDDDLDDEYEKLDAYKVYFVEFGANDGVPEHYRHTGIFIKENNATDGTLYHVIEKYGIWLFDLLPFRVFYRPHFVYERRPNFKTADENWEMIFEGYIYPKEKLAAFEAMAEEEKMPKNTRWTNCQDWVVSLLDKVIYCTDIISRSPRIMNDYRGRNP